MKIKLKIKNLEIIYRKFIMKLIICKILNIYEICKLINPYLSK